MGIKKITWRKVLMEKVAFEPNVKGFVGFAHKR